MSNKKKAKAQTLGFQTEAKQLLHLICLLYTSDAADE